MKKIISSLIASTLAVSVLPFSTAFAVDTSDSIQEKAITDSSGSNVTVSSKILNEDITVDDTVIPSGSTAFTVTVNNNSGFCLFEFDMNIGAGYDIITDSDGTPLFTKCNRVNTVSIITGAVNDENVIFTGLFDVNCTVQDGIITFYATENNLSDNKECHVTDSKLYGSKWIEYGAGTNYLKAGLPLECYENETSPANEVYDSVYMIGDMNNDMEIDLKDAYIAFFVLYSGDHNGKFEHYKNIAPILFTDIADIRAAFIWNDSDDADSEMIDFSNDTSLEILKYCAEKSAGHTIIEDSYMGMICHS